MSLLEYIKCKEFSKKSGCTFCFMEHGDENAEGPAHKKFHSGCEGTIHYDEGVEGNVCSNCHFYDGVK